MGIETIIGAIGVGASVAGTAVSFAGQQRANKAAQRAERIREAQMKMEAVRERRQQVRQMVMARAQALQAGVNQGAQGGSGVMGGMSAASSQGRANLATTNASEALGGQMFSANRQEAAGRNMASIGSGISSLGGIMMQNAGTFGRVGTFLTSRI